MTGWEKRIIDAFIARYYASASETEENRASLRVRSQNLFPDFDSSSPDEKESYLEAAESLENRGIIKLNWEKQNKRERIKTLSCDNFEKLFKAADLPFAKTEAEKIRSMFEAQAQSFRESPAAPHSSVESEKAIALLEFLSRNFGPQEIGKGINPDAAQDLIRLLEFISETPHPKKITTRALSILLYRDSKRLENLCALCRPLIARAEKTLAVPDFSYLERSYPETLVSGKIIINYSDAKTPLVNAGGHILGIPLENAEKISSMELISGEKEKSVLTIENKETFYALGSPHDPGTDSALSRFSCFLYAGGYSNRAAAALIKALAASNFAFYHAGDLDPDGILILQNIHNLAEKPVMPVCMNVETFDHYLPWARTLTKPMLYQSRKINNETKALPGIASLLKRITETGRGIEQEIVDYR